MQVLRVALGLDGDVVRELLDDVADAGDGGVDDQRVAAPGPQRADAQEERAVAGLEVDVDRGGAARGPARARRSGRRRGRRRRGGRAAGRRARPACRPRGAAPGRRADRWQWTHASCRVSRSGSPRPRSRRLDDRRERHRDPAAPVARAVGDLELLGERRDQRQPEAGPAARRGWGRCRDRGPRRSRACRAAAGAARRAARSGRPPRRRCRRGGRRWCRPRSRRGACPRPGGGAARAPRRSPRARGGPPRCCGREREARGGPATGLRGTGLQRSCAAAKGE